MPNMQERLDAAVDKAEVDTGLLHNVIHGSITTEVDTEGGKVPSLAKVLHGISSSIKDSEDILYQIANGDNTTIVHTSSGDVPSAAKAIQDIKDSVQGGTNSLLEQAQNAASIATAQANSSATSALQSIQAETNCRQAVQEAQAWADGSDAEVEAMGGRHSARTWAELAESNVKGSFPTVVSDVATAGQTILPLPEALGVIDQVLMVNVENLSLMPDTYSLSNDGRSVILQYPLSVGERWSIKYLTDIQSMGSNLEAVLYEDM